MAAVCGEDIPTGDFPKDIERIASKLTMIKYDFASGTSVIAPTSALDDGIIKMEQAEDGRSRLVVTDELSELKGKAKSGARPKKENPTDGESPTLQGDESSEE
jgi:hypothetical protein